MRTRKGWTLLLTGLLACSFILTGCSDEAEGTDTAESAVAAESAVEEDSSDTSESSDEAQDTGAISRAASGTSEGSGTVPDYSRTNMDGAMQSDDPGWTILVYLCGSDLESNGGMATMNLEEMCSAMIPEDVNVLVETGGSSAWSFDGVDPNVLGRYQVTGNDLVQVDALPPASMGESSTLTDFIEWGVSSYPSAHYGLILWDHGGGNADGVCYDELYNGDNLKLSELGDALYDAGTPFDFIGFDACLMASLETTKAIGNAGFYMVASEETEPGYGWDYETVLNALGENTSMHGDELGQIVCDAFLNKCSGMGCDEEATLSVIDLSMAGELNDAFDLYTGGMALAIEDAGTLNDVVSNASRTESYGGNTDNEGYCNMVDIADLVSNTQNSVQTDGSDLLSAIDQAVLYKANGPARGNSNGISVFYPIGPSDDELATYMETSDNVPYRQYIAAVTDTYDSVNWDEAWDDAGDYADDSGYYDDGDYADDGEYYDDSDYVDDSDYYDEDDYDDESDYSDMDRSWTKTEGRLKSLKPVTGNDFEVKFEQTSGDDGYLHLTITSGLEAVTSVRFLLFYMNEGNEDGSGSEFIYLGMDNNINGDMNTGEFTDNFFNQWMTIGGEYVSSELIDEEETYNIYSVPAVVNGVETNLRVLYDYSAESYRMLGRYDGVEDSGSMTSRGIMPLNDGDQISFMLPGWEMDTDDDFWYYTDPVTWSDDVAIVDEDMGDGTYMYMFEIEDMFGREYDADPVVMQAEGDSIYQLED